MKSLLLLLLVSCNRDNNTSDNQVPPPDLTVTLSPGETRAGFVSKSDALFGGISAEGKIGDIKIYNDRVRFIIQNRREGSYYIHQSGNVIDADIVRPAGQPGRDMIDEWAAMAGIGHLLDATQLTVESNGLDGDAVVMATGWESPLDLLNGILEYEVIKSSNLKFRTEYRLPADSWFLQVTTTVTAMDGDVNFNPGDAILAAQEGAASWVPGVGYKALNGDMLAWRGYVGKRNELAFGIFSAPGDLTSPGGLQALGSLIEVVGAFGDAVDVSDREKYTWTRYYGVGPDPATLSDAWLALGDTSTETVAGLVSADDGPVVGARVTISVGDSPYTLAITREGGLFSADVPAGSQTTVLADGRGMGVFFDGPEGAAQYSLYADTAPTQRVLTSLEVGAPAIPVAQGRGIGSVVDPLTLQVPATVAIEVADGLPFAARLEAIEPI
ncbi:MAG: hypothetical protein VCB43_00010, partial [Myxococcota bacterium]